MKKIIAVIAFILGVMATLVWQNWNSVAAKFDGVGYEIGRGFHAFLVAIGNFLGWFFGALIEIVTCWWMGMRELFVSQPVSWSIDVMGNNPIIAYLAICGFGLHVYWLVKAVNRWLPSFGKLVADNAWWIAGFCIFVGLLFAPTAIGAKARGVSASQLFGWFAIVLLQVGGAYLLYKLPAICRRISSWWEARGARAY